MSGKRIFGKRLQIGRRDVLKATAVLAAAGTFPAVLRRARAQDKPVLVNSIRSLANPYHAAWDKGGAAFAASVAAEYMALVTEGDSAKGLADIKAILAKTGGNVVINVDPNDTPDARPIVEACHFADAFVVTQWNKAADLHPWDHTPNYSAHISFDGVAFGKAMTETLIKAMGGTGGIVALDGIGSNIPAVERQAGLKEALAAHPDVKLLDTQAANWSASEALDSTKAWLKQFGDEIGGIWSANDEMALAAVEALKAEGRAGKVAVIGFDGTRPAVEAIMRGEMAGTVAWDPFWQGGMGLAIGYAAKTRAYDPGKEPREHREFYGTATIITAETAQKFHDENFKADPKIDWTDRWSRVSGQIRYN